MALFYDMEVWGNLLLKTDPDFPGCGSGLLLCTFARGQVESRALGCLYVWVAYCPSRDGQEKTARAAAMSRAMKTHFERHAAEARRKQQDSVTIVLTDANGVCDPSADRLIYPKGQVRVQQGEHTGRRGAL